MKTPAQLMRALLSSAVIASGLTAVSIAGPVSSASAARAFTVDRDSVITVHSSTGIAGSNNPRIVGLDSGSTETLDNSNWLLRGGAVAPDGTLYLQDASVVPTRLVKIAPDGTESVVTSLGFPAAGQATPTSGDVVVLPDGDLVVSAYRSPNTRFTRVDPDTGTATTLFTLTGGESAARTGVDAAGSFYYFTTLTSPKRVWKVSPIVGATPTLVGGTGDFGYDMAVDAAGHVYVGGAFGGGSGSYGRIEKLTNQGDGTYSAAAQWAATPSIAQGALTSDGGMTVTPNGHVVMARHDGAGTAMLYRFSSAGGAADLTQGVMGVHPQVLTSLPGSNPFSDPVDASIDGTIQVGQTLTGSAGTYAPSDATIGYAWKVGSDTVSTTSTYVPKLADAGKALTLTVTGTKSGFTTSTSTTTGQTIATVQGFTGTVEAGKTLTASDTSGTLTWGLSTSSSCASPTTSTGSTFVLPFDSAGKYVQLSQTVSGRTGKGSCVGPVALETAPASISGAPTASGVKGEAFTYGPSIVGGWPTPTISVVGTLPAGVALHSASRWLLGTPTEAGTFPVTLKAANGVGAAASLAVTITIDDVVTGLFPSISGTPKVGEQLTASPGGSLAPSAGDGATVTYLWQYRTTQGEWSDLTGGATYTPGASEVGRVYRVRVTVSKSGFQTRTVTSSTTAAVAKGTFGIDAPSITGTAKVGETLTCAAADGTPGTISYAWTRGATPLGTDAAYQLKAADRTHEVTCTVTSARTGYDDATASKDSATVGYGTFSIDPPSITGTAKVGETLTCAAAPGTPGTVSYAWTRGATALGTAASYDLVAADRTEQVTCTVTSARAGYDDATASKDSATVGYGTFGIDAPSITGTAAVGETLTCAAAPGTPGTVSYAWTRGATPLGTEAAYELTAADRTEQVTCTVTSERAGYTDASSSKDSPTVGTGSFSIGVPTVTGTAAVGETLTCAAAPGTPGTVSYAWTRGATPLGTEAAYELTPDDRTHVVTCTVTSERAGYTDASNELDSATVDYGTFTIGAPTITGTAEVGKTLTCAAAPGTPGTVSYAWTRGATPLGTDAAYELTAADGAHAVTCTVTSERAGYTEATNQVTSAVVTTPAAPHESPAGVTGLKPSIVGTMREGAKVTADAGNVAPSSAARSYQWFADGKKIKGATAKTLRLGRSQAGRKVSVRVTATAGAAQATATSTARMVSSSKRRLVITGTAARGEKVTVTATGLRPGRTYAIWLGGQRRVTGTVGSTGTVSRTLAFGSKIRPGIRRVRVSTYKKSGTRATTIVRSIRYR